jgi:hypothetical protein
VRRKVKKKEWFTCYMKNEEKRMVYRLEEKRRKKNGLLVRRKVKKKEWFTS